MHSLLLRRIYKSISLGRIKLSTLHYARLFTILLLIISRLSFINYTNFAIIVISLKLYVHQFFNRLFTFVYPNLQSTSSLDTYTEKLHEKCRYLRLHKLTSKLKPKSTSITEEESK